MRRARSVLALLALAAWPALARPVRVHAEAPAPSDAEALLARVAPAVVDVRFTVAVTFSFRGQSGVKRLSRQTSGVVVDPSGLVLTSDSLTAGPRSPVVAMIERALPGIELKLDLEELRVSLGDGTEELAGLLVARDGRNDIAWLQVADLGERRLAAVDLAAGREPRVGEALASVGRLGRGFGYAPYWVKGRVTSQGERPRRHWDLTTDADDEGPLLYFAAAGAPLGVLAFLSGAEGTDEDEPERRLLPLDVVRKSLETARARVPEALEKARAAKEPDAKEPEPKDPDGK
jgi:S1-C subfamily serine protease